MLVLTHLETKDKLRDHLSSCPVDVLTWLQGRVNDPHWHRRVYTIFSNDLERTDIKWAIANAMTDKALEDILGE